MSKCLVHFLMLIGLFLPAASLSSPIGSITKVVVAENGIGPKSDGCATFVLNTARVRAFFDKAVLISRRQEHDFFLYGPCSARGSLETRYDTWQWEIRNMGTATITATNGEIFLLANPEQESSLADDGSGP